MSQNPGLSFLPPLPDSIRENPGLSLLPPLPGSISENQDMEGLPPLPDSISENPGLSLLHPLPETSGFSPLPTVIDLPPFPASGEFEWFPGTHNFTEPSYNGALQTEESNLGSLKLSLIVEHACLYAETSLLEALQQAVPSASRDDFIAQTEQKISTINLEISRINGLISAINLNMDEDYFLL